MAFTESRDRLLQGLIEFNTINYFCATSFSGTFDKTGSIEIGLKSNSQVNCLALY